jgi:hypothetical protein
MSYLHLSGAGPPSSERIGYESARVFQTAVAVRPAMEALLSEIRELGRPSDILKIRK